MASSNLALLLEQTKSLPSIPKIVAEVLQELDQLNPEPRKIANLVKNDPTLTARIIKLANSAFFGATRPVYSIEDAFSRLGFNHVRSLVTAAALGSSFKNVPGVPMELFWQYSLNTAKLCKLFARHSKLNDSAAFTMGLVHGIGELVLHLGMPVVMQAITNTSIFALDREAVERARMSYSYVEVSTVFAQQWMFPEHLVSPISQQHAPLEGEMFDKMAAVLHLAAWRSRTIALQANPEEVTNTFPSVVAILLNLDLEQVLAFGVGEWASSSEAAMFS